MHMSGLDRGQRAVHAPQPLVDRLALATLRVGVALSLATFIVLVLLRMVLLLFVALLGS